ncbi:MAG: NYN domain-containing protein [Clostridiales bacterium]|jgi:hypothetical protein|nr:NYN domain-containing protein [Clostridiales bacterium]
MSEKNIAVLIDTRGCDFSVDDFHSLFAELLKRGEVGCVRFYNYDGTDEKLNEFIKIYDYEVLPSTRYSNTLDSRIVIDCLSLLNQGADSIVLVNVSDDEVLIGYLTESGVKVFAIKCHSVPHEIYALYNGVYMLIDRYLDGGRFELQDAAAAAAYIGKNTSETKTELVIREKTTVVTEEKSELDSEIQSKKKDLFASIERILKEEKHDFDETAEIKIEIVYRDGRKEAFSSVISHAGEKLAGAETSDTEYSDAFKKITAYRFAEEKTTDSFLTTEVKPVPAAVEVEAKTEYIGECIYIDNRRVTDDEIIETFRRLLRTA